MSLINDALKRASQTPPPLPPNDQDILPMQPVEKQPPRPVWPVVFLPLGLMLLFGAAVWFFWHGWAATLRERKAVAARELNTEQPPSRVPPPAVVETPAGESAPIATSLPRQALKTNAVVVTNVETVPSEPPKPAGPAFKLQGIFYRENNPSAVINSKTLFVGETLENAKVVAIDRSAVTVVSNGKTNVLILH